MATPEGKVKQAIKKLLSKYNEQYKCIYYFFPVQTGYGKRTLDVLICCGSKFCAVEAKAPGKHLTKLQQQHAQEIHAAGGVVFVVDSVDSLHPLELWLKHAATLPTDTYISQTQNAGGAGAAGGAQPVQHRTGVKVEWADPSHNSPRDSRSLLVEETWIRPPESDPHALSLARHDSTVRGAKENVRAADDEPARLLPKQHGHRKN
jgi:hypothetical protein